MRHPSRQTAIVAVSLLISALGIYALIRAGHWQISLILWIASILLFITGLLPKRLRFRLPRPSVLLVLVLMGVLLLPAAVRLMHYTPFRIHGDDLLTAYFSLDYHPRTTNFFSGIPQNNQWVSSFPAPYFFLQKLMLQITGANVLTVKWSVLPYILMTSIMLFFITLRLTNLPAAVASVWIYAFMAPSIYLETLGLHFISSTAIYLLFFYVLMCALQSRSAFLFGLTGVLCGACYLFYTSSYIAAPVLAVSVIGAIAITRKPSVLRSGIIAGIGLLLTVAPFIVTAATTKNYFLERVNQVSLIHGEWSSRKNEARTFQGVTKVVWDNFKLSGASLAAKGIGGHGGYTFNNQAFFTPLALALFILGSIVTVFLKEHRHIWVLIHLTLFVSFITGMVLTIPPPAFHRLSLTFPFIAAVSATPVYMLTRGTSTRPMVVLAIIAGLFIYALSGTMAATQAITKEYMIEDARLITYINTTFPDRHVHIAAYPTFALEKLYFFFTPKTARSVDTQYPATYLRSFNRNEPYVYIILYPKDFVEKFRAADPSGTMMIYSDKYGVFINRQEKQE